MQIIAKADVALRQLFGSFAEEAAGTSGVIQRNRKFTEASLAKTFVLGFLQSPEASDEELAQMAFQCGVSVTPQAIDQRHTPRLVDFLQNLLVEATKVAVGSDKALAPILERFPCVTVLDSSTIPLPASMQQKFPGCGGSHGGGKAAMKLQTELELRSGAVTWMEVEPGRSADGTTNRQFVERPAGSLRITDLGYFSPAVFARMVAASALAPNGAGLVAAVGGIGATLVDGYQRLGRRQQKPAQSRRSRPEVCRTHRRQSNSARRVGAGARRFGRCRGENMPAEPTLQSRHL